MWEETSEQHLWVHEFAELVSFHEFIIDDWLSSGITPIFFTPTHNYTWLLLITSQCSKQFSCWIWPCVVGRPAVTPLFKWRSWIPVLSESRPRPHSQQVTPETRVSNVTFPLIVEMVPCVCASLGSPLTSQIWTDSFLSIGPKASLCIHFTVSSSDLCPG